MREEYESILRMLREARLKKTEPKHAMNNSVQILNSTITTQSRNQYQNEGVTRNKTEISAIESVVEENGLENSYALLLSEKNEYKMK